MIDITIKTLDSRNHVFSVEDETTVKQLKEQIAEPVNVPVESQRLIYCGRVLVDDKKLSEYDVHGKVIHLVQRAPPSTSTDSSTSGQEARAPPTTRRGQFRTIITPGRMEGTSGNAMYLGAMAFPADLMDAQGPSLLDYIRISMPQPRHRLSQSRLTVARGMLRRARYTLLNLENPTHSDLPHENTSAAEDIQQDIAAHAAAIVAEMTGSTSNVGVQHPPPHINVEASGGDGAAMNADEAEPTPDQNSPEESPSGEDPGTQNANGENSDNMRNGRYRFPGPVHMADIIFLVRDIERRLSSFLERFYDLVRTDPVLENPNEAQRLFDLVSKMMHYLAHAYHAISDIMCDFSQPPPRRLRCRPVLIQHSAVLQTGIPIQASLNVSGSSNASFNTSNSTSSNNNNQSSAASSSEGAQAESRTESAASTEGSRPRAQPQPQPQQPSNESGRSNNLSGGNFEVYMDVGQGSIMIDSVEATLVTNSGQGGSETAGTTFTSAGPFPWGSPPPEFIQNLMQALAGHMMGGGGGGGGGSSSASGSGSGTTGTAAASGSGTQTSGPPPSAEANVTNSQARGNTSTQPPTSTQTRSTTRPHVHIAPGFQGRESIRGFGPGYFDPFLPCNSHHIHGSRRRIEVQETTPNNNNATSSNQSTSQSTGTSTESPPRAAAGPEPNPSASFFSHLLASLRGNGGQGQGPTPSVIRILPRDVTVLLQGSTPFQNINFSRDTTVADLLESLPEHSYTEGSSIFSDFAMTLARNMRLADVLNLGDAGSSVLSSLRPVLREFVRTRLLQGREGNQAVSDAVNRINNELRPLIETILSQEDIPLREDVDIIATINQLNHTTIPILIRDILEGDEAQFLRNIPNHCQDYARHLGSILYHCCHNGQQGLDAIYAIFARRVIVGVPSSLHNWSVVHIVNQLRAITNVVETSREDIQPFLVYRMADAPLDDQPPQPQAMDTEPSTETPVSWTAPTAEPNFLSPMPVLFTAPRCTSPLQETPQEESEIPSQRIMNAPEISSPEIERDIAWHSAVPPDWVPIISRDRERQRRQAVQGRFSDAYLAGMPSKRRKMINSAKPHTNLARVITESMTSALGAAGVDGVEPGLAETAGGDSSLRAAYKEQVRNTLTPTLRHHPDFTPEKYPTAAKLFTSK